MKKQLVVTIFFIILGYTLTAQNKKESEKEIITVWSTFLDTVSSNDLVMLKKLSNKKYVVITV